MRCYSLFTASILLLCVASNLAAAWQKKPLATTEYLVDDQGFPLTDEFGDPLPALPMNYSPSVEAGPSGLHFLRVNHSQISDPPVISPDGFPVLSDYFQLSTASLLAGGWSTSAPITDLIEGIDAPTLASRLDDTVSIVYWLGDLLNVETIAAPSNTRLTVQIPKKSGSVAVDANGGVHVLVVDAVYQLWHYYYTDGNLTPVKLSDGPVCDVVAAAGEGDVCHVAYSTFSEDANSNGALDEGEDINGNGVLDETAMQLIYQSVDATGPSAAELIDEDTLLKICDFDLHFSTEHGLKLAYADPTVSSIRLAERSNSSWSSIQASSIPGFFEAVALAVNSSGKSAISYVSRDGMRLYVTEEAEGVFSETLLAEVSKNNYFTGTDSAYDKSDQLVVLASEKDRIYLNLYTRSAVADLLTTAVRPTEIRNAFIITWPTPSENATKQVLQSSNDLSDPNGWEIVAERTVNAYSEEGMETTVESDGPTRFYRVVELYE